MREGPSKPNTGLVGNSDALDCLTLLFRFAWSLGMTCVSDVGVDLPCSGAGWRAGRVSGSRGAGDPTRGVAVWGRRGEWFMYLCATGRRGIHADFSTVCDASDDGDVSNVMPMGIGCRSAMCFSALVDGADD